MNVKRRLTLQFLIWLFILLLIFIIFGLFVQQIMIYKLNSEKNSSSVSIQLIKDIVEHTDVHDEIIIVSEMALNEVRNNGGWLQILDENGKAIYNFQQPLDIPEHYSPGEILYYTENSKTTGYYITTWYEKKGQQTLTWIYGIKMPMVGQHLSLYSNNQLLLFSTLLLSSLLLVILISWLFGKRLGGPLLHMIDWIQNLAKGKFAEPVNNQNIPKSTHSSGKLKKKFKIYYEVLHSLQQLTFRLKENTENQLKLEKTREEWMTGISHDLKTPLSSIIGYADLLAYHSYEWTSEETSHFAKEIREKARYMEKLVQDFNLTFRLENSALPIKRQKYDIVELIRRSVIDAINHPLSKNMELNFVSSKPTLFYPLDPIWFKRALDNLIMNSIVHNPPGTKIEVAIRTSGSKNSNTLGFHIIIKDNGTGMDEETKTHLFDRYYRGTNTKQPDTGTGLGMVIAQQLIQLHEGNISIDSDIGKGTKITLTFEGSHQQNAENSGYQDLNRKKS